MKKKSSRKVKVNRIKTIIVTPSTSKLLPFNDTPVPERIADLESLIASRGWQRLKQRIELNIQMIDQDLDEKSFPKTEEGLNEWQRLRDTKAVYKSVLALPSGTIRLLQQNEAPESNDPYQNES